MARVKRGVTARNRHKKVLEQAKGYYGNKSRSFRAANEQVMRSGQYAFRDRRGPQGRVPPAVDPADQCRLPPARPVLQPLHRRADGGRRRRRPPNPRRSRGRRSGGVRPPRGDGEGGTLSHQPELGFTNPKIQRLRRLIGRRSSRLEEGAFVVEGATLIAEAVRAGWHVESQFVAPGEQPVDTPSAMFALAPGVAERVSDLETPPGLFAVVIRDSADATSLSTASFVVVADRVGEPGNLGTIIRSAEAAGADAVAITPGTVDETNPKVVRASAGAFFNVPIVAATLGEVSPRPDCD